MERYKLFQGVANIFDGNYKFLVVSKTIHEKDTLIIFGDAKIPHRFLLYSWMKGNQLNEAYTFGGGKMTILIERHIKIINLFGGSGDYGFTSKKLVKSIIETTHNQDSIIDIDISDDYVRPHLTSLPEITIQNN